MSSSVRPRLISPSDVVLFLDFDGVLHPDAAFRTKYGIELRAAGELMMHAEVLQGILDDFPRVRISLSTSWVRMLGYQRARAALPEGLRNRTVSATWHSRMRATAREGYDLFTRYEQICGAVARAGITRWVAIDDDPDFSWPDGDPRLVRCDPNQGLGNQSTQEELRAKLAKLLS
ncbi:MAG: HAD domain-containing protein [Candidatus Pseudomonas phytovorans]|uniref:HAD domain-containing protein n=1 Tax=Candidatus Pseudomonas phytovorans TaxID=3121377 RepID=A0AAJ5WFD8_9PSED|nr:HAD domain-containing protein [Pseudomonas sp.]WEK29667.1 MAG: HAD domain-containing protein [Pseudomonas sp.]